MYSKLIDENTLKVSGNVQNTDPRGDRRVSLMPPSRDAKERRFFDCVVKKDVAGVKKLVETTPEFNINCVDSQGLSALHWALKNNDEDMVDLLLKRRDLDVMDCALQAIKLNQPRHVTLIMDKLKQWSLANGDKNQEYCPCVNSNDFPDCVTPMMLAAQSGHVDVISLLFSRGHRAIVPPHHPRCLCDECVSLLAGQDVLASAAGKLEVYRAICNPAYICQVTGDPLLMAFRLVLDLREMAVRNRVFLRKYEELIEATEVFAANLMSHCRTSAEVKTVLREKDGTELSDDFRFPRLTLAVDYKQKYFVAQTNVQAVLEDAWIGDWYDWKGYSDLKRTLHFLGRILMLPVLYVVCIVLPKSSWANFYSIPLNRMLSSVASYFIFLSLLFYESDREKNKQSRYEITNHVVPLLIIWFYMTSFIINSFRMWTVQGTKRFFAFNWNVYDLATELMLFLAFSFWVCSLVTVSWLEMPDLERKYWHYLDPQLLWEGFFCIGTVMAFSRLLLLVQIHDTLGPLQVSLAKMTFDCFQFIIIFLIVLGAFTAGMCRLYDYYDGMAQVDPDSKAESRQESSFVGVPDTFKVLFWGLFCMSSQDAASVVIENLPTESGDLGGINTHDFTEAVGYTLFGVFTVLTVIVLLNMLIAAMSNTFQKITENVDVEWIFGRTEVYLAYMSQTVLPPPLSFVCAGVGHSGLSNLFSKDREAAVKSDENLKFEVVMQKLVQRYFSDNIDGNNST